MTTRTAVILTNLIWIIALLTLSLIGSLSASWASIPDLPNVISVALSLASLLLAIIAIVQTLVSSGSLTSSLGNISSAAQNLHSMSKDIHSSSSILSDRIQLLESMPNAIRDVRDRLDEVYANTQTSPNVGIVNLENSGTETKTVSNYETKTTNGVVAALYAALHGYKTGRKFEYTDIEENTRSAMYKDGVLAALRMTSIMNIRQIDRKFQIDDLGVFSEESILRMVDRRLSSSRQQTVNFMTKQKDLVDAFFSEAAPGPHEDDAAS